ncbi:MULTISPECIES: Tol-Pal system beta propeller repeat protein TolB [Acetobacter]|jgi:TolB protein|uniref:Tol-Pal system protein TolB n=1 Tax=Acetobacter peroxydans TaxID=104098 RepID=A0A4Y3TXC8_9PROT|nr:Tol-Pal system beta propeller repeat protein TolB [Acetobacter peroxydans]MCH4143362.1 Tol-Pal system beta propeller repeat protein TolB [Acetobacter peroxydans]MCI1393948.1 Tol-Pal system beta propeller repeat protein TolB [Acetobacter peroxydans]MCI1411778.1 Tol-Pal system beta propeller repeat protein TolB [Acetobacter peroxydans]MCI1567237.1 Tol-Pal system beta propeller repeat protein TolB [Acetobacter peroxydans]MCI1725039.1 Tol-Pal system beta propeller repeat protein TolB [Acetobact
MLKSTRPLISDQEADLLAGSLRRRTLLGSSLAAGGILAMPLEGTARAATTGAEAEITVDQARTAPIPIIVPDLGAGLGQQIAEVLSNDLNTTGLFRVIPGGANTGTPDFAAAKAMGAHAQVTGSVTGSGSSVRVEIRLWDVLAHQQIQGTAYTTSAANWRRIAHIVGDVIYERMLGEKGYFDTRIAFISRNGPRGRQTTRLAVMDQDGANCRMLTAGHWLTLTPRFSPTRDELAFMSYANNRPRVYLFNLATGRQRILGDFQGISFAPHFSPDGHTVVLSVTRNGGSDLYTVDLSSGARRQITASGAIDTSPSFSPDGSQIVFNSDRGGSPQLYIMPANGGDARRISYGQGSYGTPVWSPRGDLIAFTRIANNTFSLGVMAPDGTGERIMTEGFTVENPSFCPNGRVLVYCRQTRAGAGGSGFNSGIGMVDITGFNDRVVPTPEQASDPTWSPLNG